MKAPPQNGAASGEPLVVFLHIPKTAGSTLTRILHRRYGQHRIHRLAGLPASRQEGMDEAVARSREEFVALPDERRREIRAVNGHFSMVMGDALPSDARMFTILREPVGRVVSMYYHIRRKPTHSLHERLNASGMSLADFAGSDLSHELTNDQTWRLAGITIAAFDARPSDNPPELLDRALANLRERFFLAGLTERFDETLLLLRRELNWTTPWYVRRNVATNRPVAPPPEEAVAVIRERNALDIALYREAVERFDARVAAEGGGFRREIARFRRCNPLYQRWAALRARLPKLGVA